MPFDSTNWKQETEAKPDLSKPSLEGLSWLLRHLPSTHQWDFAIVGRKHSCGSVGCALGLSKASWPTAYKELCDRGKDAFDLFPPLTLWEMQNIFTTAGYNAPAEKISPSMVADRIDAYLAETHK